MLQIKVDGFNGIVDVGKFVTKCDLHCTLKNYTEEKKAVFIAERLDGVAFDVYMALTDDEKKDSEVVKKALTDSFDRASRNREVAVKELQHKQRLPTESAEVFAYRILQLVNYAYPTFGADTIQALAKDYFVKGLHTNLQRELKKDATFSTKTLKQLSERVTCLEIAGVNSNITPKEEIFTVQEITSLETKIDKLINALEGITVSDTKEGKIDYAVASDRGYRSRGRGYSKPEGYRGPKQLKCRICNSRDHLFRQCPNRYCQSCGNKGHDAWDKTCPKYK